MGGAPGAYEVTVRVGSSMRYTRVAAALCALFASTALVIWLTSRRTSRDDESTEAYGRLPLWLGRAARLASSEPQDEPVRVRLDEGGLLYLNVRGSWSAGTLDGLGDLLAERAKETGWAVDVNRWGKAFRVALELAAHPDTPWV